jgi:hypothetical protein
MMLNMVASVESTIATALSRPRQASGKVNIINYLSWMKPEPLFMRYRHE